MKKTLLFVLLSILFTLAIPVSAQDTPEITCDADTLQNAINLFIGELGKLKDETDTDVISGGLQRLANVANALRATCSDLIFSGTENSVVGPVTFPAGIYKAIGSANDNGITVILSVVSGECGQGTSFYSNLLFNGDNGETVFGSDGCDAIMEIKKYGDGEWNLAFQRLNAN